jgi:hypothetical protein
MVPATISTRPTASLPSKTQLTLRAPDQGTDCTGGGYSCPRRSRSRRPVCVCTPQECWEGEVIPILPARDKEENHLLVAVGPGKCWDRRYEHPILVERRSRVHVGCQKQSSKRDMGRITTSGNRTALSFREMGARSEATTSNATQRHCRLCDPVSGRCRGLCVRPSGSRSGRVITLTPHRTPSPPSARRVSLNRTATNTECV